MDRKVFRNRRAPVVIMGLVAAGVLAILWGGRAAGVFRANLLLQGVLPALLVAAVGWGLWAQLIRPPRLELDADGVRYMRGRHRFALAWDEIRCMGVLARGQHGAQRPVLVAWPERPPAEGEAVKQVFDRAVGGYVMFYREQLAATDDQVAAAVERFGPGRWHLPERLSPGSAVSSPPTGRQT